MTDDILWLAVTPTPYNNFLFDSLWRRRPGSLRVLFSELGSPDANWTRPSPLPGWWGGSYGGRNPNLKTVRDVIKSRAAVTVVAGWNDWTRLVSLVVLALLGRRYAIWTDTPNCTSTVKRKLRNFIVRLLSARAVAVMGTGKTATEGLRSMGIPSGKIVNFPYWVRLPNGVRPGWKSADGVRFCCVGRLVNYKNFACAISALALIPEAAARLDVIGSGPELAALRRIAVKTGVGGRVNFRGFLDESAVARYLQEEADCLVHPASGYEPFGVVIAEAMAYGLPVIASDRCGAAVDRIKDGDNGFLLPSPVDPDLLAKRMWHFVRCPERIRAMGSAARRTAEEWPVERGIQILTELVSHHGKTPLQANDLP